MESIDLCNGSRVHVWQAIDSLHAETIKIGHDATVTLSGFKGNQVRLGVGAPADIAVNREAVKKGHMNTTTLCKLIGSAFIGAIDNAKGHIGAFRGISREIQRIERP